MKKNDEKLENTVKSKETGLTNKWKTSITIHTGILANENETTLN